MSSVASHLFFLLRRRERYLAKARKLSRMGLPESAEVARADAWLAEFNARLFAQKLIAGPSL